jgi:hypothetical protein
MDPFLLNEIRAYLGDCTLSYPLIFPQPNLDGFEYHDCDLPYFEYEVIKVVEDGRSGITGFPINGSDYLMVEWSKHG